MYANLRRKYSYIENNNPSLEELPIIDCGCKLHATHFMADYMLFFDVNIAIHREINIRCTTACYFIYDTLPPLNCTINL